MSNESFMGQQRGLECEPAVWYDGERARERRKVIEGAIPEGKSDGRCPVGLTVVDSPLRGHRGAAVEGSSGAGAGSNGGGN